MNVSPRLVGVLCLCCSFGLEATHVMAQGSLRLDQPRAGSIIVGSSTRQVIPQNAEIIQRQPTVGTGLLTSGLGFLRPRMYGFGGSPSFSMGFVPRHQRRMPVSSDGETTTEIIQRPSVITQDGEVQYEVIPSATGNCASCGNVHEAARGCLVPCPWMSLENIQIFAGAQGFKSPGNRGLDGSFGFHEGLNWVGSMPCSPYGGISTQIGFQATQNNFSGASFTTDKRDQIFVTAGVFRRVDWGLQWGAVFDYLHDEWDIGLDLTQIRGEISWVYPTGRELGFMTNISTRQKDVTIPGVGVTTIEATDLYAFFYRVRFNQRCDGGEGRIFGGLSGKKDGIIGTDIFLPISTHWAFQSDFVYLIPEESTAPRAGFRSGSFGESWNLAFNLVWFPRGCAAASGSQRPLFNVANNGSMLINNR